MLEKQNIKVHSKWQKFTHLQTQTQSKHILYKKPSAFYATLSALRST